MSYAAPLYSEVLEQIPKNIFPKVFAFEVLVDDFSREMSDGPDGYDKYDKNYYGTFMKRLSYKIS